MSVAEFHLAMNCGNVAVGVAEQSGCVRKCCGPGGQLLVRIIHIIICFGDLVTHTTEFTMSCHRHWEISAPHVTWCVGIVLSWLLLALEGGVILYLICIYEDMQSGINHDYNCLNWSSGIHKCLKFLEEWLLVFAYAAIFSKDSGALRTMANKISVCASLLACAFRCFIIFISACCYRRSSPWQGCRNGGYCSRYGLFSIPCCIHSLFTLFSSFSLVLVTAKFMWIFSYDSLIQEDKGTTKTNMTHEFFSTTDDTSGQSLDNKLLMMFLYKLLPVSFAVAGTLWIFWNLCTVSNCKKPCN